MYSLRCMLHTIVSLFLISPICVDIIDLGLNDSSSKVFHYRQQAAFQWHNFQSKLLPFNNRTYSCAPYYWITSLILIYKPQYSCVVITNTWDFSFLTNMDTRRKEIHVIDLLSLLICDLVYKKGAYSLSDCTCLATHDLTFK